MGICDKFLDSKVANSHKKSQFMLLYIRIWT
jgi:hypothetical protein